jgi:hypothetical protein
MIASPDIPSSEVAQSRYFYKLREQRPGGIVAKSMQIKVPACS